MVLEQILKSIKLLHYKLLKFNFNLRKITFINFKQNKKKQKKINFSIICNFIYKNSKNKYVQYTLKW